jgi:hypothetical protein
LAFLAFMALDDFFKQKMAFADKDQAQLTCFQQSDVKTNCQTSFTNLNHCDHGVIHYLLKSQVSMISGKLKKNKNHFLKAEDYDKNYISFKVSTKYEPKAAT